MAEEMTSESRLPDGSVFGLRGYAYERGVRERRGLSPESGVIDPNPPFRRIATEEAWTMPELTEAHVRAAADPRFADDPGLRMAARFASFTEAQTMLQDIGEARIARMDALGIDHQLLLLTAPGVQVLDPEEGTALAKLSNDRVADACARFPGRFSGTVAFHPVDVAGSVAEIERGMKELGLAGAILNSHFRGHYLDEPDYDPILAALEANDCALYIHPSSTFQAAPYDLRAMNGALAGFPHDVWLHVMGLIFSGAFDKYPKLRLVIGHLGEGMPLHLYRFDWMQWNADGVPGLRGGQPAVTLKHPVSHYFRNNIWVTTSGVAHPPAIQYCMDVLGPDRVLYAMDYPYQQSIDEVCVYDRMALSPEHKKMLMQENAERVFRLGRLRATA